jgi:hypothetical protein
MASTKRFVQGTVPREQINAFSVLGNLLGGVGTGILESQSQNKKDLLALLPVLAQMDLLEPGGKSGDPGTVDVGGVTLRLKKKGVDTAEEGRKLQNKKRRQELGLEARSVAQLRRLADSEAIDDPLVKQAAVFASVNPGDPVAQAQLAQITAQRTEQIFQTMLATREESFGVKSEGFETTDDVETFEIATETLRDETPDSLLLRKDKDGNPQGVIAIGPGKPDAQGNETTKFRRATLKEVRLAEEAQTAQEAAAKAQKKIASGDLTQSGTQSAGAATLKALGAGLGALVPGSPQQKSLLAPPFAGTANFFGGAQSALTGQQVPLVGKEDVFNSGLGQTLMTLLQAQKMDQQTQQQRSQFGLGPLPPTSFGQR